MKTRKKTRQFLSMLLTVALLLSSVLTTAFATTNEKREYPYGDTTAVKISNPSRGSGEDDGIVNGTDRLNSYAWAMIERGDYIYIGTNRAFISSEVYGAVTRMAPMFGENDIDKLYEIVNYFTYGELPDYTELTDEDCIPEIIRLNPKTGKTEILDLPEEFKDIAVKAEGCAFRSVVEQNGNLYFGSYGRNYVFLIRVDENDRATVAFMAGKESTGATIQYNSLRACGVYEGKQYFGGSSSSLKVWNEDENKNQYVPLFIAEMKDENYDPNGESIQEVKFDNYIADYRDFAEYADPTDPSVGNEFYDLVAYEGSLYAIISDSNGFAVYKGHPAADGETANSYGWNWTLVVDGANDANSPAHGFIAATPYIFQGKLYIGTFSSIGGVAATGAQMFMWVKGALEKGDPGRNLSDVMRPLYNLMKKDAKVFRLENDQLKVVKDATKQLEGKCAVYLWRFQEHKNELYMTTFDASILFKYVLDVSLQDILETYLKSLNEALELADQAKPQGIASELDSGDEALLENVRELTQQLEDLGFSADDNSEGEEVSLTVEQVENLSESLLALQEAVEERADSEETAAQLMAAPPAMENGNVNQKLAIIEKLKKIIGSIDKDGLKMVVAMKLQLNANTSGFDLLKTADGETWSFVLDDGFHDKYNYGGRTMVVFDDHLYVGTANPFYGAQLWRIDDKEFFTDINDDAYYKDAVIWAVENGITNGTSATTFSPNVPVTRGQMVTFLYRLAGEPEVEVGETFTDVVPCSCYEPAVAWALENGITKGTSETTFEPNRPCSRAEIVTFLYRYEQKSGAHGTDVGDAEVPFTDVPETAYYYEAVRWAVANEITLGTTETTFSPKEPCTRAQAVTFLYRYAMLPEA